jgi:hypothetical protein
MVAAYGRVRNVQGAIMINPQLLLVVGFLMVAGGLFASIGWLAAPVCFGVLAILYAFTLET